VKIRSFRHLIGHPASVRTFPSPKYHHWLICFFNIDKLMSKFKIKSVVVVLKPNPIRFYVVFNFSK